VHRSEPAVRLVIAGEFWEPVEAYERQMAESGVAPSVTILNRYIPNEEVGQLFSAADVVVMPYLDASQSGVVTLASQFGLPGIATRVGGLPEAVLDGETGLIVPPADADALARALVRFFSEEGVSAVLADGVAASRARFGWDRLVALVEDLAAERD
jgi:glycosyltransferase involved in cell wall biosynthesis